ncbi:mechanosensitive ion channel family protein [Leptolyngbya sp. NIES-2104]|uniref:mechanosensitive ion channel family protein n=1 Tax=Leptolyngbya sp. NIES-2104 TaxID=1552121 RepID=UPI00192D191F|nr:mechanosensitive ion channel family protein [Leptolyngbya sp. NIES-2104]
MKLFHRRIWVILSFAIVLFSVAAPSHAQQPIEAGNPIDGYPIVLDGKELFRLKQGVPGVASAKERSRLVNDRLVQVAQDESVSPTSIRVEEQESGSVIVARDTVLLTVRESDRFEDQSRQSTAAQKVQTMQSAIEQYRHDRSVQKLSQGIGLTLLSTIGLIGFLVMLQRSVSRLLLKIKEAQHNHALDLSIQGFQLLGSSATGYLLTSLLGILRLVLLLGSLYLYVPFVLSQFPATRAIGNSILSDIVDRLNQATTAFVQYLPNLVMIGLIALFTHYATQFIKLVIIELGRDDAYSWFYPEWIQPTNRLATLLIVIIACIVATPYLPGFNSPAFQGISLFLGALVTLGSSSAVTNAIAGIILIYTRAFRTGDIIGIGETIGEVVEKTMFVTRLITFKKEVITIPNASVLNSNVVNFSAVVRIHPASHKPNQALLLHTTVTLGYDISWRKIHEVLIQAAETTIDVLSEPQPFVLQTALNDFNVSYELNAYTNHPELMPRIYSELHQNIQDYCNQAGIEILSPAYTSLRDGNHSTMPIDYLPENYTAPSFQIRSQNQQHESD